MDKYYEKLMDNKKTALARLIDSLFILLIATIVSMGYFWIKSGNMLSCIIISLNIDIIIILIMSKLQNIRLKRFKKTLDAQIRDKLLLERIVMDKNRNVRIQGMERIAMDRYVNEEGKNYILLAIYPKSVLSPKELMNYMSYDGIIASCDFDDDCRLLCARLGIELYDKSFLLENVIMDIDEEEINEEIKAEVKKIGEIRNKRKSTSFGFDRWSRYLMSSLLLLLVSGLMGRYRIIYIAFGGMCMTFCLISLMVSKSQ